MPSFFGHPRGLETLFFTEMWERFSYYGMRAILMLFMTAAVAQGGLGFGAQEAGPIYAMYTSLVYLAAVPGGWLADNLLGQRRSVLYGGIVIMLGHILLALHDIRAFFAGLACIVIGTGLLKPNISVIVGQLYDEDDRRRDSGFSIFYMGINLGALTAPLVVGFLAQGESFRALLARWGFDPTHSWHWGFAAAAVGMFFGLVQYVLTSRHLGDAGLRPVPARDAAEAARRRRTLLVWSGVAVAAIASGVVWIASGREIDTPSVRFGFSLLLLAVVVAFFGKLFFLNEWTRVERARLVTIFVLFCGSAIFWGLFEQAGSTLTLFAERSTDNSLLGFVFPSSWWQSVNAAWIVMLSPLFAWLWFALGHRAPSSTARFSIGLLFAGAGFAVLAGGATLAKGGVLVSPLWLLVVYMLHSIGEMFLSPVGLSTMTQLAPARLVSLMMGVWFLSLSVGNFLGGSVSGLYEKLELPGLFAAVAASGVLMALLMAALVIPVERMMQRSREIPSPARGGGA